MHADYSDLTNKAISRLSEFFEFQKDGELFEVRCIFEVNKWVSKTEELSKHEWEFLEGEYVFAEDSNGNYFCIQDDGKVYFLDHETDDRVMLSEGLEGFFNLLQKAEDIELPKHKVLKVWVDPDFKPEFD